MEGEPGRGRGHGGCDSQMQVAARRPSSLTLQPPCPCVQGNSAAAHTVGTGPSPEPGRAPEVVGVGVCRVRLCFQPRPSLQPALISASLRPGAAVSIPALGKMGRKRMKRSYRKCLCIIAGGRSSGRGHLGAGLSPWGHLAPMPGWHPASTSPGGRVSQRGQGSWLPCRHCGGELDEDAAALKARAWE